MLRRMSSWEVPNLEKPRFEVAYYQTETFLHNIRSHFGKVWPQQLGLKGMVWRLFTVHIKYECANLAGVTPFTSEMNEIQGFKLVLQKKLGLFADYKPNRVEFPTSQEISLVKKAWQPCWKSQQRPNTVLNLNYGVSSCTVLRLFILPCSYPTRSARPPETHTHFQTHTRSCQKALHSAGQPSEHTPSPKKQRNSLIRFTHFQWVNVR